MKSKNSSFKYETVMLIDDNELDNFINQKIIEGNNFAKKVYVNTGGKSALEFLHNISVDAELSEKLFPSVLFVDINMPLMDGFQFIEKFEKLSNIPKKVQIVILTTSLDPKDKEKSASFKNNIIFLNKPLTDAALTSL